MTNRSAATEQLDDLSLAGAPLHDALKSLEWVNRRLGNHKMVVNAISKIAADAKQPIRITDLGCGGGDLILAIASSLQKTGVPFTITGIDGNENSLAYARKKTAAFTNINFQQADILNPSFSLNECDLLVTSHFIYHFTEEGLIGFFRQNLPFIKKAVICSELERNRLSLGLFKLLGFLLPVSKMAREDGQLAIKRSFTKKEWLSILQNIPVSNFSLSRAPFFRILLIISQSRS